MQQFSARFLLGFLIISSALLINSCNSEEDDSEEEEERPKSCGKYIYDFVTGILKSTMTCLSGQGSFKPNSIFEYATRSGCLMKCIFQQDGLLDGAGKLDIIEAAEYFERTFDVAVRDISLPLVQECFNIADRFDGNNYWCKPYVEFTECALKAILAGLIPYGGSCISNPIIGILFSALKYLAPDSPSIAEDMEELKRSVAKANRIKCLYKNCTQLFEFKKINGTRSLVIYDKDMQVILVKSTKSSNKKSEKGKKTDK